MRQMEGVDVVVSHGRIRAPWLRWVVATWTALMPRGSNLADAVFERRHRWIVLLLSVMILLTVPYGLAHSMPLMHGPAVVGPPLALLVVSLRPMTREWRSVLVTLGLFVSASVYVYLAGGAAESHFAYFVLVGVISLYQDWRPFLVGVGVVLFNHFVFGLVMPEAVFESSPGVALTMSMTLKMAALHSAFLLASTVASLAAWKSSEVQALTDVLTRLPNRRRMTDQLDRIISCGSEPGIGILYLDLCGFKKINDVYGHEAGDRLLVEIASRLRLLCRHDDFVARIGGDEFAVVLPATNQAGALDAARRVAEACAFPITVDDRCVRVTASVGVVVLTSRDIVNASEVLRDADLAMYRAKNEFGDTGGFTVFCADMRDDARAEFELELDLATCVENDELFVVYQPIVDMVSSRIVGAEALVRWRHPTKGLIGPDVFVPLAERSGAIVGIGRWVIDTAMQQLSVWDDSFPAERDLTMHVNLSTHQLRDSSLVAGVRRVLEFAEISPFRLVLEVTETALLGGDSDLVVLRQLKEIGVQLALDDFGTGYSSLSHLAHLPVDNLKIDKSFTDDVPIGPNRNLMAGVLALAGQVGMTPVVEGIERPEQVRDLLAMGARFGQGYFFSKPVSSRTFVEQLHGQRLARGIAAQSALLA